jgi:hypothetical protein
MALANLNTADFIQGSGVSQNGNVIDVTGGGGGDLEAVLTTGNDGGALQIKNIANPTNDQDAATKIWVLNNQDSGLIYNRVMATWYHLTQF